MCSWMCSAQLDMGLEHIQMQIAYFLQELCPSETLCLPFGSLLSPALCNSHEMYFLPPKPHFYVIQTNYIGPSCLSTQCKCKYTISQDEAKTHFRTLKMSFQNQIPDDSQAMISIIELLRCGDYNFAIGQSAGEPHKEKNLCTKHHSPKCWQVWGNWKCSTVRLRAEQDVVWNLENVQEQQIIFPTFFYLKKENTW